MPRKTGPLKTSFAARCLISVFECSAVGTQGIFQQHSGVGMITSCFVHIRVSICNLRSWEGWQAEYNWGSSFNLIPRRPAQASTDSPTKKLSLEHLIFAKLEAGVARNQIGL
jgi:hypothetical protein